MARSKGTWTRTLYKHGIVWWLLVVWWWRPIAWFSSTLFATMLGFKRIETRVMGRRK